MASRLSATSYTHTFDRYVAQGVELMLGLVQQTPNLLPDELRMQALHTLSYALHLPEVWPTTRDLLLAMAPKMEQAGHREDWIPYLERGVIAGEGQGEQKAVAEYQLQLGLLYRLVSDFEQAKQWFTSSKVNFAQIADDVGQARALNELAWVGYLQHREAEASDALQEALRLLPPDHPERGMSYRVFGMIAIDHKRWYDAEEYHRRALAIFERQDDPRKIAWGLQNLGFALRGQMKFDLAIRYFQQAAFLLQDVQDHSHWAVVQMNLGLAFLHSGQPDQAIKYFANADQVAYKRNDTLQQARICTNRGLAYLALKELSNAEEAFTTAVALYSKLGDDVWRLNAMDGLAMTYLAQQRYVQASKVLEVALSELDKITGTPNYDYLLGSLHDHLAEAKQGQSLEAAK